MLVLFVVFSVICHTAWWLGTLEAPAAVSSIKPVRFNSRPSVQPTGSSAQRKDCRQEIAQPPSQAKEYILL